MTFFFPLIYSFVVTGLTFILETKQKPGVFFTKKKKINITAAVAILREAVGSGPLKTECIILLDIGSLSVGRDTVFYYYYYYYYFYCLFLHGPFVCAWCLVCFGPMTGLTVMEKRSCLIETGLTAFQGLFRIRSGVPILRIMKKKTNHNVSG